VLRVLQAEYALPDVLIVISARITDRRTSSQKPFISADLPVEIAVWHRNKSQPENVKITCWKLRFRHLGTAWAPAGNGQELSTLVGAREVPSGVPLSAQQHSRVPWAPGERRNCASGSPLTPTRSSVSRGECCSGRRVGNFREAVQDAPAHCDANLVYRAATWIVCTEMGPAHLGTPPPAGGGELKCCPIYGSRTGASNLLLPGRIDFGTVRAADHDGAASVVLTTRRVVRGAGVFDTCGGLQRSRRAAWPHSTTPLPSFSARR
jgi:hypothetical protein